MSENILVINGVNLSYLGQRESVFYGDFSLKQIQDLLEEKKSNYPTLRDLNIKWHECESEESFIKQIHQAINLGHKGIIYNPGAFSHYSYAISDALKIFSGKKIEVHLSQIYQREAYRQNMVTAASADMVMIGAGHQVYLMALFALGEML